MIRLVCWFEFVVVGLWLVLFVFACVVFVMC